MTDRVSDMASVSETYARWHSAFSAAFITQVSEGGEVGQPPNDRYIKVAFKTLDEMHDAYSAMAALASPAIAQSLRRSGGVAVKAEDLEEALRLAEIGEYLYNNCAYSYGDGYTEPREYGIGWQWQQSKPNEYGQGQLLAAATAWHEGQSADGILTEASKLRSTLSPAPEGEPAVWRLPSVEQTLSEMLTVATGSDNDELWMPEQRGIVDLWQASIRKALASPPEPVEVTEDYPDADQNERLREALKHLVRSLDDLISESEGVYGLHLNGDLAPWGSLVEGGQFEQWLIELERARAALKREGE